jgi:hypothetical protein
MPNLQTIDILEIGHKCFNSLQNLIFREYGFADMQEVVFPR